MVRERLGSNRADHSPPTRSIRSVGTGVRIPARLLCHSCPFEAGGQPLGLLLLGHHTAGRYGSEALLIASTLASYAAVAIQNNRLFTSAQEQAWISTILLQVAETSQALRSAEELAETLTRLIPLLVGVKQCAIFVWDEARHAFFLLAEHGLPSSFSPHTPFDNRIPAVARLLETKSPIFIQDPAEELAFWGVDLETSQGIYLILPLLSREEILALYSSDTTPNGSRTITLWILSYLPFSKALPNKPPWH